MILLWNTLMLTSLLHVFRKVRRFVQKNCPEWWKSNYWCWCNLAKVSRTLIQVEFCPNVILIFILLFFVKILFPVFWSGSWGRVEFIFLSTLIWYTTTCLTIVTSVWPVSLWSEGCVVVKWFFVNSLNWSKLMLSRTLLGQLVMDQVNLLAKQFLVVRRYKSVNNRFCLVEENR